MSYLWTDPDIADALRGAEAIEIAKVADHGSTVERINDDRPAHFYSAYVRRPGEGVRAIADRDTEAEIRAVGEALAGANGLELVDLI